MGVAPGIDCAAEKALVTRMSWTWVHTNTHNMPSQTLCSSLSSRSSTSPCVCVSHRVTASEGLQVRRYEHIPSLARLPLANREKGKACTSDTQPVPGGLVSLSGCDHLCVQATMAKHGCRYRAIAGTLLPLRARTQKQKARGVYACWLHGSGRSPMCAVVGRQGAAVPGPEVCVSQG